MKEDTLKIVKDVLRFYADPDNWKVDEKIYMSMIGADKGVKARLALSCILQDVATINDKEKKRAQETWEFSVLGYDIVPCSAGYLIRYQKNNGWGNQLYMGTEMCLTDALEASKTAFINEELAHISLKNYLNKKGIKNEN
jgi:hypothetical protein